MGLRHRHRGRLGSPGLNEEIIRLISAKKNEPEWMLDWRLKAYRHWLTMKEPHWAERPLSADRLSEMIYYSAPKREDSRASTKSIRNCWRRTRSWASRCTSATILAGVAVDAVFDSVSVATTFKNKLAEDGHHLLLASPKRCRSIPSWCRNTSARSCPTTTTFSRRSTPPSSPTARSATSPRACAARWSCRTYFRINAKNTGQFERTLIIADEGATSAISKAAPPRCAMRTSCTPRWSSWSRWTTRRSSIRTVQNWYPGDKEGKGGIYNFVTKRGACRGVNSQDLLDAGRDRLGHHLEIPQLHPAGRQLGRRVLLRRPDQQLSAGRHRHEDDPHRQEHPQHDRLQGHLRRPRPEHLPRPGEDPQGRDQLPAITPSAIRCCSATSAARTRSPTSKCRTPPAGSSTKPRRQRSAKTSSSTASSAASRRKTRST